MARTADDVPDELEVRFQTLGLNARTGCQRVDCDRGPDREQDWTQRPPDLLEALSDGPLTVRSGLIRQAPHPACTRTRILRPIAAQEDEAQISGAT